MQQPAFCSRYGSLQRATSSITNDSPQGSTGHPARPSLSLAGVWLKVTRFHRWGFPCCGRFPGTDMPTPLPRRDWTGVPVASSPSNSGLSRNTARSAPTIWYFEACSAFTHVSGCLLAEPPKAARCTRGFGGFVASSAAPVATGWSDPLPGGTCTHWKAPPLHGAQYFYSTGSMSVFT